MALNCFGEQGGIRFAGLDYAVVKHGWLSGKWTLEHGEKVHAEAHKPRATCRAFQVHSGAPEIVLEARSAFTRSYEVSQDGVTVGTIRPIHAFTRRAVIECDPGIPELTQLFCFWLVALTWRRSANSS